MQNQEFSKRIIRIAEIECWVITIMGFMATWFGKDLGLFTYLIPAAWSGYAVARAFYYNKAKAENAIKLKKEYQSAGVTDDASKAEFDSSMNEEIKSTEN